MIPYYMLVFVPVAFSAFSTKSLNNERNKRVIRCFFVLLFLLLALRASSVGTDIVRYKDRFLIDSRFSWRAIGNLLSEPAWFALEKTVGIFTDNFQWMLTVVALITIFPIAYTYNKEAVYPVLTIALFISMATFVMLFSGLRQSVSIALGMIAYDFTKRHKLIPFLLIVFLTFLFHRSAFMLFFMYPLYHAKITKKWLPFVIPTFAAIYVYNRPIFAFLTAFISDFYEESIYDTGAGRMLALLMIFCIFSFVIPDERKMDEDLIGQRNFLLLATAVQMFAPLNSLAMRMGYYYLIFIPLLIPRIIQNTSARWRQVAELSKHIMIVYFIANFFITAPENNTLQMFPYRFFWESVL